MNLFATTRNVIQIAIALLTVVLYCRKLNGCNAKKIDSFDLLVGDWETSVRLQSQPRGCQNILEIFSNVGAATTSTSTTTIAASTTPHTKIPYPQQDAWQGLNPWKRSKPHAYTRNIPCCLSLYANGTFGLTDRSTSNCDNITPIMKQHQNQQPLKKSLSLLLIRGKWKLLTNPYCVTDRFYDQIVLESFPRVQKELLQRSTINNGSSTYSDDLTPIDSGKNVKKSRNAIIQPIQKVQLKLHCRLSGHFTGNRYNSRPPWWQRTPLNHHLDDDKHHFYYARGKMTHGVMILDELDNIQNRVKRDDDDTISAGTLPPFRYLEQLYRQRHRYPRQRIVDAHRTAHHA